MNRSYRLCQDERGREKTGCLDDKMKNMGRWIENDEEEIKKNGEWNRGKDWRGVRLGSSVIRGKENEKKRKAEKRRKKC